MEVVSYIVWVVGTKIMYSKLLNYDDDNNKNNNNVRE